MGISRQESWSGSFPPPEDLPYPGIEPESLHGQEDSLPLSHPGRHTRRSHQWLSDQAPGWPDIEFGAEGVAWTSVQAGQSSAQSPQWLPISLRAEARSFQSPAAGRARPPPAPPPCPGGTQGLCTGHTRPDLPPEVAGGVTWEGGVRWESHFLGRLIGSLGVPKERGSGILKEEERTSFFVFLYIP